MTSSAPDLDPVVTGWRCAVCGATTDISTPFTWKCPNARPGEPHLPRLEKKLSRLVAGDHENPFVAFRPYLAWDAFAASTGLTPPQRTELVVSLDRRIEAVGGVGFRWTPMERSAGLSEALGFAEDGGVWVKNDTGNVAGSHKARHLMTIALHLLVAEQQGLATWNGIGSRPSLAIASCGNAALAASTLAAAMQWPISVFVPQWASEAVVEKLTALKANIVRCPRRAEDPPGDPCVLRFREAVAAGAIPFAVQGPENAWCHDGGRTIGWELGTQFERTSSRVMDRLFVQVGGGAFASCAWRGVADTGRPVQLHAVQTAGCAPLARAWERAKALPGGAASAASHWRDCMWPWEDEPHSIADGILDDETYDWIPIVDAMNVSQGSPVVAPEELVERAWSLTRDCAGIDASPTGTAGLAGRLALRDSIRRDENVVVIVSGVRR